MKKIAGLALFGFALLCSFRSQAQTYTEQALLYSRIRPGGSARIQAMGGAQVSLGGDYSSAVSNPGGLGMFNRSEFTFSPGMNFNTGTSSYFGNDVKGSKSQFEIPGFSLALHSDKDGGGGFLGGTFGITYNRLNDFNRTVTYAGVNPNNSLVDALIPDANGRTADDIGSSNDPTGLGYNNYLFDNIGPTQYASPLDMDQVNGGSPFKSVNQTETIKTTGAQNQLSFAYGANFSDKVFIGAGIGFTTINFQETKSYSESNYQFNTSSGYNPINNMQLTETLKTSGSGVNGTLGIIVRPINSVQIGVSYISPTWYHTVSDAYQGTMTSQWNHYDYYGDGSYFADAESDQTAGVISNYALATPSRINFGATYFVKKLGFITGDIEYTNYGGAHYTSNDVGVDYNYDNNKIKNSFQSTINYRAGYEFRYKGFRLRSGYGVMFDPYKTQQNGTSTDIRNITLGVGYKTPTFYIDVAYVNSKGNSSYRPYDTQTITSPLVTTANANSLVMVTFGFPFFKN